MISGIWPLLKKNLELNVRDSFCIQIINKNWYTRTGA